MVTDPYAGGHSRARKEGSRLSTSSPRSRKGIGSSALVLGAIAAIVVFVLLIGGVMMFFPGIQLIVPVQPGQIAEPTQVADAASRSTAEAPPLLAFPDLRGGIGPVGNAKAPTTLRASPDTNSDDNIIDRYSEGAAFEILTQREYQGATWLMARAQRDGKEGWLLADWISLTYDLGRIPDWAPSATPTASTATIPDPSGTAVPIQTAATSAANTSMGVCVVQSPNDMLGTALALFPPLKYDGSKTYWRCNTGPEPANCPGLQKITRNAEGNPITRSGDWIIVPGIEADACGQNPAAHAQWVPGVQVPLP